MLNLWECEYKGCTNKAYGIGGAAGLIAIGWYYQEGKINPQSFLPESAKLFCPVHHPENTHVTPGKEYIDDPLYENVTNVQKILECLTNALEVKTLLSLFEKLKNSKFNIAKENTLQQEKSGKIPYRITIGSLCSSQCRKLTRYSMLLTRQEAYIIRKVAECSKAVTIDCDQMLKIEKLTDRIINPESLDD